jgi:peptide/nickel transport system substrate-binding protein
MASVEAPDAQTVVVTINDVYAPWLTSIFLSVIPQHILQPVFDKDGTLDNADFNRLPSVSSGPFIATDRQTGNYILFKRNDNYFDAPAKLDQIYVRIVPDDAAQVAALLNGDVDLGIFIAPDDAKTLQEKGVNIVTVNSGYNEGIFFNFKPDSGHDAIQELAVRQAIAYGLNRDGIASDLLKYGSAPDDHNMIADTYWHDTPWANPDVRHEQFDADKARQILQDAGWVDSDGDGIREKNGRKLHLTWATNDRVLRTQVQAVGQQQLKDIGIEAELVNIPSDTFFGSYADGNPVALGEYDFWEFSDTTAFPDPNTDYWKCSEIPTDDNPSGVNNQYLCDKTLDNLFNEQAHSADPEVRKQDFFKIEQLIADNLYWMPLWHDPDLWALTARFENANLAPTTQFSNAANWDISS